MRAKAAFDGPGFLLCPLFGIRQHVHLHEIREMSNKERNNTQDSVRKSHILKYEKEKWSRMVSKNRREVKFIMYIYLYIYTYDIY